MKSLMVALIMAWAGAALAQGEMAPSPPWMTMCQAMESRTVRQVFVSDECSAQFYDVFNQSDVATTHAWMIENKACFKEWAHFSWVVFAANDMKMAELAWVQQLYLTSERVGAPATCTDRACVVADVEAKLRTAESTTIGEAAVQHTEAFFDEVQLNESFKPQMDKALAAARPLCLLHFNFECIGAMKKALTWMYPRSYRLSRVPPESITFSMLDMTRYVFEDTQTQKYASRLALHLIHAIESGQLEQAGDAFYPLAVQYFEGDYDRLWKFLAVYATRGAAWATGFKAVSDDNQAVFAAMMVISSAMGYLDTHYDPLNKAWSYISAEESTCFQYKPYHYWMSGSFAYFLRKEGYSARTSKQVSRLLGAMYEVASTTMGRDPDDIFFVPTFDPAVNRARREVAHHARGALAGINYRRPANPDFDWTLERLINASEPLPNYTDAQMRAKIADAPTRWKLWTKLVGFYESFGD